jgi:hypothetical protein
MIDRRRFLQLAAAGSMSAMAHSVNLHAEDGRATTRANPLVGIQMGPYSIMDEGSDRCLDVLQEKGAIDSLFIYTHTYHLGAPPPNILATDHGIPIRDFRERRLPRLWVRHSEEKFREAVVGHQNVTDDLEYGERDFFQEIIPLAHQRGMKVYARILEAGARRKQHIPGYEQVLTVDLDGEPGHGPCWNNPHYRRWVFTTVDDMLANYPFDGLQYGAERTGPLSLLLFRGMKPGCFCPYCVSRNGEAGIDVERARRGFRELVSLIDDVENDRARPADGIVTSVLRTFYRFPEVLSWDYQWFRADEEICSRVHEIAKERNAAIDSGRHVDHQRSSWDIFYRAATTYGEMAENADFIKPILYHEAMGPRLRWWVLDRMKDRVLNELTLQQSLDLYYALFGQDESERPSAEQLDAVGLGPEYVYRETRRCKQGVGNNARVYSGIGIDIPWYIPGGMEPRPSDPERLKRAVRRALDAGADGVLASREYNEMRISSLTAFGDAVREWGRR